MNGANFMLCSHRDAIDPQIDIEPNLENSIDSLQVPAFTNKVKQPND
jgi:hypothetical protein